MCSDRIRGHHRAAVAKYSVEKGQAFRTKLIYFENEREFPGEIMKSILLVYSLECSVDLLRCVGAATGDVIVQVYLGGRK